MRLAASSPFAEHVPPGLIDLFASRANDLDVELNVRYTHEFGALLGSRSVDVAIGPKPARLPNDVVHKPFLNYQIVVVAGPSHPLAKVHARPARLRDQTWFLGPSAAGDDRVSLALSFAVADDMAHGRLVRIAGPGINIGRFRPSLHVMLWS